MNLDNAKILGLSPKNIVSDEALKFISGKEYVLIGTTKENDTYSQYRCNEHHFTTGFHRRIVIPALTELLSFNFKRNEYHIVSNTITAPDGKFDLSYYAPNDTLYRFDVTAPEYDIHYKSGFNGLLFNEKYKDKILKTGAITDYHKLYAFPHSCSIVKNLYKHNNRTLLVSGDSQAIPFISTLCTVFKEVWYFDNRSDMSFKHLLEKANFTDILIEIWKNGVDYYTVKNLK